MSDMEKKVELPSAELVLRVPFHDVDALGVVWHGNYFRYLEQARCELLRQIGYDYPAMEASGYLWPVIDTRLKFIASLRFDQLIRVAVRVTEYENRLRLDYTLFDAVTGRPASTTGWNISSLGLRTCRRPSDTFHIAPSGATAKLFSGFASRALPCSGTRRWA